jgi:hypothetical protein
MLDQHRRAVVRGFEAVDGGGCTDFMRTAWSMRSSIECSSSPQPMAPAIRALPFKVCRARCSERGLGIGRIAAPLAQGFADVAHQIDAFFEEQRQDLGSISSSIRAARRSAALMVTSGNAARRRPGRFASDAARRADSTAGSMSAWIGSTIGQARELSGTIGSIPGHRIQLGGELRLLAGHATLGNGTQHAFEGAGAACKNEALRFARAWRRSRPGAPARFQGAGESRNRHDAGCGGNAGRGVCGADHLVAGTVSSMPSRWLAGW